MATHQDGAAAAELIGMLKLASFDGLQKKRTSGPNCSKSQKHCCCDCLQLLPGSYQGPKVRQLPIKLDVIHHIQEKRSRSSAVHATVPAADDTKFIDYSPSMPVIPEYDPPCALILFSCGEAKRVCSISILA
jgi:hypothetical protein